MLRTIIIDDEERAREVLKNMVVVYCEGIELVGEADSVKTGIKTILAEKPDLVFLDIQLRDGTGFDLLSQLPKKNFKVIFATAYDAYALNAFRFNAVDYILKPIEPALLVDAVDRVKAEYSSNSNFDQRLEYLLESNNNKDRKIGLPALDGITFVRTDEIIRCQSENNYTKFYLKGGGRYIVSKTLKEYDDMLTPLGFCRIHKSHLINPAFLKKYIRGDGGFAVMEDGSELEISRRRKDTFLKAIAKLK